MAFVKVLKTRAYFKRYQVKFKRRRQGKTDYYQRKRLVAQDKDKYNTRKYRLIVRSSNKYVVCQIAYATISGDVVICQANSKELVRYGIMVGLSNYAAFYATGLLVARRLLQKFMLDKKHLGCTDPDKAGEDILNDEPVENVRTFKAILDLGLSRSSTGAKVFGAMKGALDGGLNVPHSTSRFVGTTKEDKEYKPEVHRDHIFGTHVANYMREMMEKDQEAYKKHFSKYIENGITPDTLEDMYKKAHELIRADPSPSGKKERKVKKPSKKLTSRERKKQARRVIAQRAKRVEMKKERIMAKIITQKV